MPGDAGNRILCRMSTKSRQYLYGTSIRMSEQRAKEARKKADLLACEAWNQRMLGYQGPAQPSPTIDQRVKVDATGLYTYPDILVIAGPICTPRG